MPGIPPLETTVNIGSLGFFTKLVIPNSPSIVS